MVKKMNQYNRIRMMVVFIAITQVIFASATLQVQAQPVGEWKEFELRGQFNGLFYRIDTRNNVFRGSGDVFYSYGKQKISSASGDTELGVIVKNGDPLKLTFSLFATNANHLGMSPINPASIKIPKEFTTENEGYHFVEIGHVYLMKCGGIIVLVEIEDLAYKVLKVHVPIFGTGWCDAECSLKARYIILADTPAVAVPASPATINLPLKKGDSPPSTEVNPSAKSPIDSNDLLTQYEQFQKDAKDFMDLPTEEATIARCDKLLEIAKSLNTQINDVISDEDSTITGNNAKISSLNERLAKITDLQLKDRIQTRITKIKAETEKLQKELKEWTARLDELQKTEKRLKEYKLIIGI
jgi:hypothetical protein